MKNLFQTTLIISSMVIFTTSAFARDLGQRELQMWQTAEWTIDNVNTDGNPFDTVANVIFQHQPTSNKHTTEMYYNGDDNFHFRFTATQLGEWTFESKSKIPALNNHTGTITVTNNTNPKIRGFATYVGNKFAIQVKNSDDLQAYVFNAFMSRVNHPAFLDEFGPTLSDVREQTKAYFQEARDNGFEIIFIHVNNNWFQYGVRKHSQHTSENPDPLAFEVLEEIIKTTHQLGGRVHIWAWGDESREWTPKGVPGGINGKADKRLQRYIAARLGPLPGWTMGYGFDLHEWTNSKQLNTWAEYLHQHFGWQHLLCARGHILEGPHNINSYDGFDRDVPLKTTSHGPTGYAEIAEDLASDIHRPHFYEERHSYKRSGFDLDMEGTRRLLWAEIMAGGMGGFFGFYPDSPHPYPKPEQLRTAYTFWHEKERFLLDMHPQNNLTSNGYALRDQSKKNYVFYKTATSSIEIDLSDTSESLPAIAVDAKKGYREITIGQLNPSKHTWKAPYESDWAIAVGHALID